MMQLWGIYVIMHLTKPTEYKASKMKTNVKHQKWKLMENIWSLGDYNMPIYVHQLQ